MRKALVFTLAVIVMGGTALAEAPTNRAIGWENNGISYRVASGNYTYQGILNFNIYSPDSDVLDTETDYGITGFVLKPLWSGGGRGNVAAFAGFEYMSDGSILGGSVFSLRIGLEPEYFIAERISATAKWGIALDFADGYTNFGFTGTTLGGLALNWYF